MGGVIDTPFFSIWLNKEYPLVTIRNIHGIAVALFINIGILIEPASKQRNPKILNIIREGVGYES